MNRVVPSGPSTDGTARSWQELLRSIASKGEKVFAAGAQGAPERSQRTVAPLGRGQPPSGRPTPYGSDAAGLVPI